MRDRLADESADAPTLAELAAMTGLRNTRCCADSRSVWRTAARLAAAAAGRALKPHPPGAGLAAAAAACGFADQSHMTRVFVRQFGFTPGAWRKAALQ